MKRIYCLPRRVRETHFAPFFLFVLLLVVQLRTVSWPSVVRVTGLCCQSCCGAQRRPNGTK